CPTVRPCSPPGSAASAVSSSSPLSSCRPAEPRRRRPPPSGPRSWRRSSRSVPPGWPSSGPRRPCSGAS
ncbi:MAG: hypothetical protein AVDCRST_MAG48-589, partial [uncultured Friedmanniella sp.]